MQRILYVEDEPVIRYITLLALEEVGGLTVEATESGTEGLEKVKAFGPDIILLDVMMPVMDGPETLAALRSDPATAGIPVVFMTAKSQAHEIARYLALGAIGVITKPFDPMTLSDTLKAIWEKNLVAS